MKKQYIQPKSDSQTMSLAKCLCVQVASNELKFGGGNGGGSGIEPY